MGASSSSSEEARAILKRQNSRESQGSLGRSNSHFWVPEEEADAKLNGLAPPNVRNDFIKKVYGILTIEILYTTIVCFVFLFCTPVRESCLAFVDKHPTAYTISLYATMFPSLCALSVYKNRYPHNYISAFIFVTVMAFYMGTICAIYYADGQGLAVAEAFVITTAIFLSLSLYAHCTQTDFTYLGGFLYCALVSNILLGLFCIFTGFDGLTYLYDVCGILIFCGFILYDTSCIIHKYGVDDYMIASIELYLDFLNLMLYILSLLGDR